MEPLMEHNTSKGKASATDMDTVRRRAAARRSMPRRGGRKRQHHVQNGCDAIVIDSDDEEGAQEVIDVNVRGVGKARKFVTLIDSSDEDEENRENCSPRRKRAKPSASETEAADRALAECLHREEERLAKAGGHVARPSAPSRRHDGGKCLRGGQDEECKARRKPRRKSAKPSTSETEASDRALAERLHREEERLAEAVVHAARPRLFAPSRCIAEEKCLRKEQDEEYEETLLADQIKEVERRDADERERCVREEREEEERFEAARRASELESARARTEGGEPPENSNGAVTRLRLSLPSGKKVDRRFLPGDTLGTVRSFLLIYFRDRDIEIGKIGLVTNFPKMEFGESDDEMSLEEAGLAPHAMVMVRDLDA